MRSDWPTSTIAELILKGQAVVQTGPFGSQLHSHDYVDIGVPVIPTEAIGRGYIRDIEVPRVSEKKASELDRHRLQLGDILFARRGAQATGLSAIVDKRYVGALCGTGALLLRLKTKDLDPNYLARYLSSDKTYQWLRTHAVGAVMPNINTDIIKAIPILIPPIREQRQLAEFFGSIDERIILLREMNATLEAIAQALFKSWFVDFDPVRAKQGGQQPDGMDEATAALFPNGFEESELGFVPKGWEPRSFTETVTVIGGGTPKTANTEYWNGDIPWYSVVDAPKLSDVFVIDTEKHISEAGVSNSSTKLLPAGTTIISARGTVGKLALTGRIMAMNQSCYGLSGKANDSYFTYFSTYLIVETLKQRTHGSVFDTITRSTLDGVTIIYPTKAIIDLFEISISPVMERMKENLELVTTLSSLRDTLLPRLISGQLRIADVESMVDEAVS
ncbi:restriction endonuclease subunit S [Pseudoduganella sp. FT93W]|uniref:Restriction endonuclease subunit S n=1 Tax=Duganella fentianensis TaxID=2692177 RepID=A0A845I2N1_9BURK|nr:restriction endonuclease subunit S [Duganella fentianensis]MYN44968.1 restriction endonuclease subunit S [Duganella fentianensis]